MNREDLDRRHRRLLFRSWHRGMQETDILLGTFADSCLSGLDETQLGRFEALLECTDADLFDWITGHSAPRGDCDHDVMDLLKAFCAQRHGRPTPQLRTTLAQEH